jgi:hypothetical protein
MNGSYSKIGPGRKVEWQRRDWQDGLLHFTTASKGAIETFIITPQDQQHLALGVLCQDPTASAILQSISMWIDAATAPGAEQLCLDCDTVFRAGGLPLAFAIAMPFANREHALVTGICAHCCVACAGRREDLHQVAIRRWRAIWPGAYSMGGGRA